MSKNWNNKPTGMKATHRPLADFANVIDDIPPDEIAEDGNLIEYSPGDGITQSTVVPYGEEQDADDL